MQLSESCLYSLGIIYVCFLPLERDFYQGDISLSAKMFFQYLNLFRGVRPFNGKLLIGDICFKRYSQKLIRAELNSHSFFTCVVVDSQCREYAFIFFFTDRTACFEDCSVAYLSSPRMTERTFSPYHPH